MGHAGREGLLGSLRALPAGGCLEASSEDLAVLLEGGCLNTVVCDEPYARACLLEGLSSAFLSEGKVVCVLDLDTWFTAHLEDRFDRFVKPENLVVVLPEGDRFDDAVVDVCSSTSSDLGLIVLDSATGFYHTGHNGGVGPAGLNRKLGLILMLLQKRGIRNKAPIVVTSFLKPRVGSLKPPSYAGGRLLEKRSRVILSAKVEGGFLGLTIVKHVFKELVGRRVRLRLV